MIYVREKRHRLPLHCYRGQVIATFTLCVENREPLFTGNAVVDRFREILKEVKDRYSCKNWVYIFMPDHIHLVNEGISEESDLWKMMNLFKQKAGFWLSKNREGAKWQKDFYDHIHRKEDDLKKHIMYILNNPVRKGLVSDWREYLFKGSLDFNLEGIIS